MLYILREIKKKLYVVWFFVKIAFLYEKYGLCKNLVACFNRILLIHKIIYFKVFSCANKILSTSTDVTQKLIEH